MGAGSSTGAGVSPDLAKKILTQIFTQTDMGSYLSMTDPKVCVNFTFPELGQQAQTALQGVGAQIKVGGPQNAALTAVCFDQAKGYSKGFEIFAALYPLLADSAVKRTGVPLVGGLRSGRRTRRVQRGGAIQEVKKGSMGYAYITRTTSPLYAIWLMKDTFTMDYDPQRRVFTVTLYFGQVMSDQAKKGIIFDVSESDIDKDFEVTGQVFDRTVRGRINTPCRITIRRTESNTQEDEYALLIEGEQLVHISYNKISPTSWEFTEISEKEERPVTLKEGSRAKPGFSNSLLKKIQQLVGIGSESYQQPQGQGKASTSYGALGLGQGQGQLAGQTQAQMPIAALGGSFFPQAPANIKGVLKNIKDKKKNTPIALAVARALILLRQIDPANSQGPPTTQICSQVYTFEGKDSHVPRKGVALDKSFYFKSWMNLYTDRGELRGGRYEWTQSSDGLRQLEEAAKDLSVLYSTNPQVQPDSKFLSKPLPEFIRACPNRFTGEYYIPPQVLSSIQKIVKNLLTVQSIYSAKANAILAKVFTFKPDGTVEFRREILGRQGMATLSAVCVETRNMLFEYYMKVESLFIEGVMIYEQAQTFGLLRAV